MRIPLICSISLVLLIALRRSLSMLYVDSDFNIVAVQFLYTDDTSSA